jgi:dTDP-4-amino-4,6-dideoxygalactose transaminase
MIPVHLFGCPADMDPLLDLANDKGLKVLEDVAQAWGARYKGRITGSMGDAAAFSFFPSKNLGAFGDGGLLTTDDDAVAKEARKLRFHGSLVKYRNEALGYNSRLDAVQAAMLSVKLRHVDAWNEARQAAADRYRAGFEDIEGVTAPTHSSDRTHVYHQYTVRIPGGRRDAVRDALQAKGIQTMVYYPTPIHRLPVYDAKLDLPHTDAACAEVLSLPIGPHLLPADQDRVIEAVADALRVTA